MTAITPPPFVTRPEEEYGKGYYPKVVGWLSAHARPYARKLFLAVLLMLGASAAAVAARSASSACLRSVMSTITVRK